MESSYADGFNDLKATELRLGLPGTHDTEAEKQVVSGLRNNKRALPDTWEDEGSECDSDAKNVPASKAQVVGWPPIRSYRKNSFLQKKGQEGYQINNNGGGMYVKISMDGAPYLRKIDLNVYKGYPELLEALENMFKLTIGDYSEREGYKGSEYAPTYEDKDGDWMLVGDVPWEMFISSCKRLRIMKGSEAKGLGCGI
ncbi:auxin-induced protein 22D-like [Diospyros lotus]|uniref:auxin-induced protein 22D-like n=1 Tax=Diospyros lotus TaxID=55363 RepID=UPI00225B8778|nr:auxin-induced protein 22D-like [Diospyros lotus]